MDKPKHCVTLVSPPPLSGLCNQAESQQKVAAKRVQDGNTSAVSGRSLPPPRTDICPGYDNEEETD